jgi:hypothetical protein
VKKVKVIMESDWGGWTTREIEEGTSAAHLLEIARQHWNRPKDERLRITEKSGNMQVRVGAQYVISRELDGMTRVAADQLQVWFKDWTYCLDRTGKWKQERVRWERDSKERSKVRWEKEGLRIDREGEVAYWLYEDGHWEQREEHPLSGADRQAPPVGSPALQKTPLPRLG